MASYSVSQKLEAIRTYRELGSYEKVINYLGYPANSTLWQWLHDKELLAELDELECKDEPKRKAEPEKVFGTSGNYDLPANLQDVTYAPIHNKLEVLKRIYVDNENILDVAEDTGYGPALIYKWKELYQRLGAKGLKNFHELDNANCSSSIDEPDCQIDLGQEGDMLDLEDMMHRVELLELRVQALELEQTCRELRKAINSLSRKETCHEDCNKR